ncbi:hypothetical protein IU500_23965 [Nocardia terpenica]|uniref:hypothetical protein n=1 Tax=Nocardia terpenica TaxID=455432 RepID=UPI00189332AA|nr:hypothetical protein [Nocardia terpenica]MBF6063725.1 hypothetical protein [Nocardia terpenica]MBF6107101.1 hypothetical protein [Nocardia terpenica]MBF6114274.1 hypothetical protein [Nocardia terpenica]MBF6121639.1 hypothetical protein [Nocardia terpenica]MBF6154054.1 hypothetical protein [Nocardia terpenica]
MALPLIGLAAALWEQHKNGPPDSFANARGDQSPDATAARNRIGDLVKDTGLQYQSAQVPQDAYKNPASLDDVYGRIQKMDLNSVATLHATWEGFRNKLEQGHNAFGPVILKALKEKWTGLSGEKAAAGVADFVAQENNLVVAAQLLAEKVKLARSGAEITKSGVQATPGTSWTSDIASWVPGPTWKLNDHRRTEADNANDHLINNVFYPAIRETDSKVPLAPQPINPINAPAPVSVGPGGATPGGNANVDPAAVRPGTQDNPGTPDGNEKHDSASADAAPTDPANTTPSSTGDSSNPNSGTSSTAPAGRTPADTGTPTRPSSYAPGSYGGGLGGGFGNPGAPGSAAPGRSVPGKGTPGLPTGTAARTATGANPGSTGGPGGFGGLGGKGKNEEEEKTHKSKISEALVSEENGDELTGLGRFARKTIPPVLGEDALVQDENL